MFIEADCHLQTKHFFTSRHVTQILFQPSVNDILDHIACIINMVPLYPQTLKIGTVHVHQILALLEPCNFCHISSQANHLHSSSRGPTVICNAVGFTHSNLHTMHSAAILCWRLNTPTRLTTASALASVSSFQPRKSCPTISSKSLPSQSCNLTLGCFLRNPRPSQPKLPETQAGAAARKAFWHNMVTLCPLFARAEERMATILPVPPAKTMLKPWVKDECVGVGGYIIA